ncbi:MAG: hypothetical protein V4773_16075 [Verrucomicrobiota bacterium]
MRHLPRFLIALALVAFVAWFFWSGASKPAPSPEPTPTAPTPATPATLRPSAASTATPEPDPALAPASYPLNSPTTDIRADLRLVSETIDTFRSNFPKDGNPVGNNAEITAALTGKNKLRFPFIPPKHPAINRHGELCDRWGTPFFFHAESATKMEIRSAGPDKKLHTADDVTFAP